MGMDGSGYLVFRWEHCDHCLTKKCGEHTLYCHQVLEAKLFGPAQTVFSVGSEFIDNRTLAETPANAGEQKRKQDCELKAARRLLEGVRKDFPQLRLCLSLDALYCCGAGFQLGKDFKMSYVIVFKEGSIPTLWKEFQTLLGMCPENRLEVNEGDWKRVYRWVDELPYTDSDKREWKPKAIHYKGEGPGGKVEEWSWVVSPDLTLNETTVEAIANEAGRARWREENQGFNMQKNSGLNLEHAYSEGEHFGVYYVLLQIAHILLQLVEKGSLLRELARQAGKRSAVDLLGSLKNIAEFLVESLRNCLVNIRGAGKTAERVEEDVSDRTRRRSQQARMDLAGGSRERRGQRCEPPSQGFLGLSFGPSLDFTRPTLTALAGYRPLPLLPSLPSPSVAAPLSSRAASVPRFRAPSLPPWHTLPGRLSAISFG
jgi:hypothetical protein